MKVETAREIRQQLGKLLPIVRQLEKVWVNNPLISMCEVLIQNASFDGSDCVNYSFEEDVQQLKDIHKAIELLNENSYKDTFIAWLWLEVDSIVTCYIMSEDFIN